MCSGGQKPNIICWTITLEVNPGSGMMVLLIMMYDLEKASISATGISLYVTCDLKG